MLGTDLFQAYEQASVPLQPTNMIEMEKPIDDTPKETVNMQPSHPIPQTRGNDIVYEQESFLHEQSLQQQLAHLQNELAMQKKTQKQEINIIDRFISKKKEVIKLVLIALTILLAFSSHYLVVDLIKNYLNNTVLSGTQEMLTKVAYPVTVLLMMWTIKVFNK